MRTPLVSICLPNLNTRPFLEERMETILAQTVTDWELIVCDSYSEDGAWEYFQKFKDDPRVHLHQVPRKGVYAGWNECLRRARGEYIYIATSDDTADPRLLEVLLNALGRFPDVKMATSFFSFIDENSAVIDINQPEYSSLGVRYSGAEIYGDWLLKDHRRHGPSEFVATCVDNHVWLTITCVLFRTSLLKDVGLFAENKTPKADFEWGLRSCLFTDTVHVGQNLATYRIHRKQATQGVDFAKIAYVYVTMIEDTFRELAGKLPPELRDPLAQQRLLWPKKVLAFNSLELYWNNLLKSPGKFAERFAAGAQRQPSLTLQQMLHGFSWRYRPQVDARQYVEEFLEEFGLPPVCRSVTF